jgi:endogenous inhibitor of DNA gyrase (YacG/DUF329 family)
VGLVCNRCHKKTKKFEHKFCSEECESKWQQGDFGKNHYLTDRKCPDCGKRILVAHNVALMCEDLECGYILCSG